MQPLDLNVENRLRVDLYALFFCDICSKLFLLGLLDCQKTLQYSGIVGVTFQLLQVVQRRWVMPLVLFWNRSG